MALLRRTEPGASLAFAVAGCPTSPTPLQRGFPSKPQQQQIAGHPKPQEQGRVATKLLAHRTTAAVRPCGRALFLFSINHQNDAAPPALCAASSGRCGFVLRPEVADVGAAYHRRSTGRRRNR